ncbi:MAG: hypothetical protein ACOYD6_04945 [Limnochordia bacterium]|jgi:hypothetical protein
MLRKKAKPIRPAPPVGQSTPPPVEERPVSGDTGHQEPWEEEVIIETAPVEEEQSPSPVEEPVVEPVLAPEEIGEVVLERTPEPPPVEVPQPRTEVSLDDEPLETMDGWPQATSPDPEELEVRWPPVTDMDPGSIDDDPLEGEEDWDREEEWEEPLEEDENLAPPFWESGWVEAEEEGGSLWPGEPNPGLGARGDEFIEDGDGELTAMEANIPPMDWAGIKEGINLQRVDQIITSAELTLNQINREWDRVERLLFSTAALIAKIYFVKTRLKLTVQQLASMNAENAETLLNQPFDDEKKELVFNFLNGLIDTLGKQRAQEGSDTAS